MKLFMALSADEVDWGLNSVREPFGDGSKAGERHKLESLITNSEEAQRIDRPIASKRWSRCQWFVTSQVQRMTLWRFWSKKALALLGPCRRFNIEEIRCKSKAKRLTVPSIFVPWENKNLHLRPHDPHADENIGQAGEFLLSVACNQPNCLPRSFGSNLEAHTSFFFFAPLNLAIVQMGNALGGLQPKVNKP